MNDHTSVEIFSPHYCDFHVVDSKGEQAKVPAEYDAATTMGPWADMCESHFRQFGTGLGLGKGQRLILKSAICKSCEDGLTHWCSKIKEDV